MKILANLIIVSVDMSNSKIYVISEIDKEDGFSFPKLEITEDNKRVLEEILTNKAVSITGGNKYELFPQIIVHHYEDDYSNNEDVLNLVFGFLVTVNSQQEIKNNNYEWKEYLFTEKYKNQESINDTLTRLK
jgi:hypothetical protein